MLIHISALQYLRSIVTTAREQHLKSLSIYFLASAGKYCSWATANTIKIGQVWANSLDHDFVPSALYTLTPTLRGSTCLQEVSPMCSGLQDRLQTSSVPPGRPGWRRVPARYKWLPQPSTSWAQSSMSGPGGSRHHGLEALGHRP